MWSSEALSTALSSLMANQLAFSGSSVTDQYGNLIYAIGRDSSVPRNGLTQTR